MDSRIRTYQVAADYIRQQTGGYAPLVGIVLGSGLGRLADQIEQPVVIPYRDIPGFPVSTAVGHKGNFIIGRLGGKTVIAMQGRFHYYEGYPMDLVTIGVRTMAVLGVKFLFVSNAAGAANPAPPVGPALGQAGVNIMQFCKEFNAATQKQAGLVIPVVITVYQDRSFTFITKSPPAAVLLKKAAGIETGAHATGSEKVGKVTRKDLEAIAETKKKDLNARSVDAAVKIIAGTARSMGIEVVE